MNIYDFIRKYDYAALKGKHIDVCGQKYFIHDRLFTPEETKEHNWAVERIKRGRKPCFRLYGGITPDAELVYWIYPTYEVIEPPRPRAKTERK